MQETTFKDLGGHHITITTSYKGDQVPPNDTLVTKVSSSTLFSVSHFFSSDSQTPQTYRTPTFTYTFHRKYYRGHHEITTDMQYAGEHIALHHTQLSQLGDYLGRQIFFPAPAAEEARACWERETGELRLKLLGE